MKSFFSPSPLWFDNGIAFVRIFLGLLIVFHGMEVFNREIMNSYLQWDNFKDPSAKFLVYMGKASEFTVGVLLTLGLLTRVGSLMAMGTFSYITFFVGGGRFWYEDQHPFMFTLFGLMFFFTGPGTWSLDQLIFKPKQKGIS